MSGKHIYEVIRFEQGVAIFLKEHLQRLYKSALKSSLCANIGEADIYNKYNERRFDKNKIINMRIEVYQTGYDIKFAEPIKVSAEMYEQGVNVKTVLQQRKDPNVKSNEQSYYARLCEAYKGENIFEFILYDNGILKEGTRSNFFGVKGNKIYTQDNKNVLMGVTRAKVFMLAESLGIEISYDDIYIDKITQMDAFFITGTSIGVMPIKKIDNTEFESAKNHTVLKLHNAYNEYVGEYIKKNKNRI